MAKHLDAPDETQPQPLIWRTKVAVSAVLMLAVVVATVFGFRWLIADQPGADDTKLAVNTEDTGSEDSGADTQDEATAPADAPAEDSAGAQTIVHVAGEVHASGIVELSENARVVDAIEAAGGPTQQAQLDALNLAEVVNDGDYILVPDSDEATRNPDDSPQTSHAGPASGGDAGTVDINTADATALETLPGIGPATAADIIAHREQHGPFTDLSSLEEVSGIGPATRERLDGLVSW